eukprot:6875445-Heterocapsa_arctica.AAC.1
MCIRDSYRAGVTYSGSSRQQVPARNTPTRAIGALPARSEEEGGLGDEQRRIAVHAPQFSALGRQQPLSWPPDVR